MSSSNERNQKQRLRELDALRGLAALVVVFGHISNLYAHPNQHPAFPTLSGLLDKVKLTPLFFFFSGHESVILFYLLSGFVLSLPFFSKKSPTFKTFIVRRFFRIYAPYIIALIISATACLNFSKYGIPWLSPWFNGTWTTQITWQNFLSNSTLIGNFNTAQFNPAIWSLVHEMRISLIFPLIVIPIITLRSRSAFCIALVLSIVGIIVDTIINNDDTNLGNLGLTIHYMSLFIIGGILSRNTDAIRKHWQNLKPFLKYIAFFCFALCYLYGRVTKIFFGHIPIYDWFISIGAAGFIIIALSSKRTNRFLYGKLPQWLGRISYSLYLTHTIVIFSLVNCFAEKSPLWALAMFSLPLSILFAWFFCILVEEPAHHMGVYLTSRSKV